MALLKNLSCRLFQQARLLQINSPSRNISFELNDQQKEILESSRKFTKEEVIPNAAHHDETGEYPWEIFRKAFDVGLMNTTIPQEYGGIGNKPTIIYLFKPSWPHHSILG